MPRILLFKDPEPEEINGFKDITEAVNFLDIIIQCDGQSINNKEHFCFTHRTIEPHEERSIEYSDGRTEMGCFKCEACAWRRTIRYINEPSWYAIKDIRGTNCHVVHICKEIYRK